ncbi:tetratricopeptide repeat protein [Trichocoleus sp. FACHB-90]|uniref:tetratricopeptide repeat protein n=1 Tax=Trichocoleus sp. FACHB-90 TaxID=2692876 RepID=UPI001A7E4814|nr:tetratricopeptide repeat protein [Trichocoleus sp. FACHB-90]
MTFLDFAEGFTIGFIEINFYKDLDTLIEALKKHPKCKDIQFELLNFNNPELRFLRDAIIQKLPDINIDPDKKLVLILQGLEKSIGMFGEYPPVLQDLNFVRDSFTKSVPHPILFCLPDYAITRLAKFAPDFWAWKSGVFHFNTVQSTKDDALAKTLQSEKIINELELPEKQERVDLLHRLLMEYSPSGCHETEDNLQTRIDILTQLGEVNSNQFEFTKATEYLEKALKLVNKNEDLKNKKITVMFQLGAIYVKQGQVEQGMAFFLQSLGVARETGERVFEAIVLNSLGDAYSLLEEYQQAIESYQQSLAIVKEIGTRKIEGIALNALGDVYNTLEQYEQAIECYHQCLEFRQEIGNRKFEAITLSNLGDVYNALEQYQQAIESYQQCLAIVREIGDRKFEAIPLNALGDVYNALEQYQQAIESYQQCLAIAREIGTRKIEGMALNKLGGVYRDLEQYQQAIECYHQCLEIRQEIGDRQFEVLTLNDLGGVYNALEQYQQAIECYQQCLKITREIGECRFEAVVVHTLGYVYTFSKQYQQAIEFYQQALKCWNYLREEKFQASALMNIGKLLAYTQGDFTTAVAYLQESLAVFQQFTSPEVENVSQMIADVQQMADAQESSISGNT